MYLKQSGEFIVVDGAKHAAFADRPIVRICDARFETAIAPEVLAVPGFDKARVEDVVARANGCLDRGASARTADDMIDAIIMTLRDIDFRERLVRWTTAPADYDGAGTREIESFELALFKHDRSRTWRTVAIAEADLVWQTSRYASGLHAVHEEDPRALQARYAEEDARRAEEQARVDAEKRAVAEWLAAASLEELKAERNREEGPRPYLDYTVLKKMIDEREETHRRSVVKKIFDQLASKVQISGVLIDRFALRGGDRYGLGATLTKVGEDIGYVIRQPQHYDGIKLDNITVDILTAGGNKTWTLEQFCLWLDERKIRYAEEGKDVPPRKVTERLDAWSDPSRAQRIEVDGVPVWAGFKPFGGALLVLDSNGHLVRRKAVLTAVNAVLAQRYA